MPTPNPPKPTHLPPLVKCDKKSKETTQCDKRTVTGAKVELEAMLVLLNVTIEPSNLRKKK